MDMNHAMEMDGTTQQMLNNSQQMSQQYTSNQLLDVPANQDPQEQCPAEPQAPAKQESSSQHDDSSSSKKDKKREAIEGQAREIIFKVIKFFESEKRNRGYAYPVENVMKRASAATGLSESTIKRIKRDGIKAEATNTKMAGPKKKRIRRTKVQLDYYQLCALRGIVNAYSNRKEVPTLSKILSSAKEELNYRGGKESLRLILLNKLGIKFKKCEKKNNKPKAETPEAPKYETNTKYDSNEPKYTTMPQMHPQQNMVPTYLVKHNPVSVQNTMMHPQMVQMKPPENHCVYEVSGVIPPLMGL